MCKILVLSGPEGCGKTRLAEALANLWEGKVMTVQGKVPEEIFSQEPKVLIVDDPTPSAASVLLLHQISSANLTSI